MTTLGLLETDTLYPELLADYGSYGQMFARFSASWTGICTIASIRYRKASCPLNPVNATPS